MGIKNKTKTKTTKGKSKKKRKKEKERKMSLHFYRAKQQDPFEKFFSQAMQPFHTERPTRQAPKMDLVEKENVNVKLDGKVLTVTVEKNEEKKEEDEKFHWQERFYGKTSRSIRLSDDVDIAKISAKHENNGVLKVHIPKIAAEELEATTIPIH